MKTKVRALTRKQVGRPAVAISAAAIAGPSKRPACTIDAFSDTALTTRSRPTISVTKL